MPIDFDQNWVGLADLCAPYIEVDYSRFGGPKSDALPAAEFVKFVSDPTVLGDPESIFPELCG